MHVPTLLHLIRQIRVRIIYFVMDIRITGLRIIIYLKKRKKYGQEIILNTTYKIQNICVTSIKRYTIKAVKDVMIMTR